MMELSGVNRWRSPQETITKSTIFFGEGGTKQNISIDPVVQYRPLLGVSPPEIGSDVFIEKGQVLVY
jgi:hypothetical protein